ncbi:MAG TPA: carboxylating nicotinate-nucleotide diphosphorylase [Cyclobacteriaceae bacterium]|nr:carboxylating nicotinate-nucleotide diphosphorylase [Cyclobacteriaceae bacterium]HMV07827.1 carboxylating nicotinate-nucleotide diphosphorylase [Cyclobacteriaceae bacterium]HMV88095.1 carboxylating nicotinate-nucleotide diphosphorylase [Cyclobacteriaceae bacterium]HMW98961.1 carboxylating nicotinate-nucleotide diphosphorylase [Cyclobacteriaceae bacterium]HMX48405.1 carboxylating nicotinate-nucleotide diphosphorylase [Cyclobacteriaceae bacterium]
MRPAYITDQFLQQFITSAFAEDVGDGDHSTLASIPASATHKARLLVKQDGIIAGVELAEIIFRHFDSSLKVSGSISDGQPVKKGDVAFVVEGSARSILTCERLVLNCMQRMSGIATYTRYLSGLIAGTHARLLDTRKTTPNFRLLEKWAVIIGGGLNHRIGLYDMIMLKDNHVDMAGGIAQAINQTKEYLRATKKNLRIEIETRNLEEVKAVLETSGVDVIMLDNMSTADMKQAVALIAGKYQTEASGGITDETIRAVAETGVDFISVGALTHSIKSMDLSLKAF